MLAGRGKDSRDSKARFLKGTAQAKREAAGRTQPKNARPRETEAGEGSSLESFSPFRAFIMGGGGGGICMLYEHGSFYSKKFCSKENLTLHRLDTVNYVTSNLLHLHTSFKWQLPIPHPCLTLRTGMDLNSKLLGEEMRNHKSVEGGRAGSITQL